MVDGSHLSFEDNLQYTQYIADLAHRKDIYVEAELGRLSGTEDDLTVEEYEARFTDINQVGYILIKSTVYDYVCIIELAALPNFSVFFRRNSLSIRLALMLWQYASAMSMENTRPVDLISGLTCLR